MKRKIIIRNAHLAQVAAEAACEALKEVDKDGEPVLHELILRPYKSSKTNEQLAKIHAMLKEMADYCGESPKQMKADMKIEFLEPLSRRQMKNGDWACEYPSFADLTVSEMSEMIENVQNFAFNTLGFVSNG